MARTAWDVFWGIKFPLILPTVGIVGVLTFVGNFNAFDLVYATQGAIGQPELLHRLARDTVSTGHSSASNSSWASPTMGATIAGVMFVDYSDRRADLPVRLSASSAQAGNEL